MGTALSLGSIIFGLIAWGLPVAVLLKSKKGKTISNIYMVCSGFTCAILSLLLVITNINHLVVINDLSAIIDTAKAFQFGATFMSVIACALNGLALSVNIKNLK